MLYFVLLLRAAEDGDLGRHTAGGTQWKFL